MLKRLLVPLDGSDYAECVLPHVVALAKAFGSEVVLLQVMDRAQLGMPPALLTRCNGMSTKLRRPCT